MTDHDTLREMLDRAGVTWEVPTASTSRHDGPAVLIQALTGEHNLGYPGFVTIFFFTKTGDLESVGVWE